MSPALREIARGVPQTLLERVGRTAGRVQEETPLPADILESETAYRIILDAPGATPGDVQIQLDGNVLEVRIDRFRPFNEGFEMVFPGRGLELDGTLPLPEDDLDPAGASAELTDRGTLEVTIPKASEPTNSES
ncbi:MAG: Hsp20/alpha crystallin family protein [Halodesulfurarchaeum sp.]